MKEKEIQERKERRLVRKSKEREQKNDIWK